MATNTQNVAFYGLLIASVIASGAFGIFGYNDTKKIVDNIYQEQDLITQALVERENTSEQLSPLLVFASLEADTMIARNKRASAALAARTWLRYSMTIIGAILAIYGASFVVGQITIAAPTEAEMSSSGFSAKLHSTSPGLVLAFLGFLALATPAVISQEITTTDAATYGNLSPLISSSSTSPPPPSLSEDEIRKRLGINE